MGGARKSKKIIHISEREFEWNSYRLGRLTTLEFDFLDSMNANDRTQIWLADAPALLPSIKPESAYRRLYDWQNNGLFSSEYMTHPDCDRKILHSFLTITDLAWEYFWQVDEYMISGVKPIEFVMLQWERKMKEDRYRRIKWTKQNNKRRVAA